MAKGYKRSTHMSEANLPHGGSSSGKGRKTYDASAHSMEHHNVGAVGAKIEQNPMHYPSKLHSEGMEGDGFPNRLEKLSSRSGKAVHHPRAGAPHNFPSPSGAAPCGFGSLKAGKLRVSGHSGAHRLGSRSK